MQSLEISGNYCGESETEVQESNARGNREYYIVSKKYDWIISERHEERVLGGD